MSHPLRVRAPGKVLLTGAYAVLEGAPALVLAVDRYAVADGHHPAAQPSAEVTAAFAERGDPPDVDVTALHEGGQKLGLGSSAAALVASLGMWEARRGCNLTDAAVRNRIFTDAWAAHRRVQGGGSGVDIAASVYGGLLRYEVAGEAASPYPASLPPGLALAVFFSGTSARTSELRALVEGFRARDPQGHAAVMDPLRRASVEAAAALELGDGPALVDAAGRFGRAFAALGRASGAPLTSPAALALAQEAGTEGSAFFPSGAGGGDVAIFLGMAAPSTSFVARARSRGMTLLPLAPDLRGVHHAG